MPKFDAGLAQRDIRLCLDVDSGLDMSGALITQDTRDEDEVWGESVQAGIMPSARVNSSGTPLPHAHQLDIEISSIRWSPQIDRPADDLRDQAIVQIRGVAPHRSMRAHAPNLQTQRQHMSARGTC